MEEIWQKIKSGLEYSFLKVGKFELTSWDFVQIAIILVVIRLLILLVKKFIRKRFNEEHDTGRVYAVVQVSQYLLYTIAIVLILDILGVNITVLIAGSTALLVGIGLGLQALFNDLVSGFLILSERTVTAGDIIEVNGMVGEVKEVNLRTTTVLSREHIVVIIPNHKFVNENVINWTQNGRTARFRVSVGVAYGSDTGLIKELLLQVARENKDVAKNPAPLVHFRDFGDSALIFDLIFFSKQLFRIELVKSDLRFAIDKKFREHKVTIPFPQRDLHVKSSIIIPNTTDNSPQ
jgi:small-conductance mechanosensitive channel